MLTGSARSGPILSCGSQRRPGDRELLFAGRGREALQVGCARPGVGAQCRDAHGKLVLCVRVSVRLSFWRSPWPLLPTLRSSITTSTCTAHLRVPYPSLGGRE